ncbi:hypothetical protein BDZ94DRAFT_286191 [Collybia nuda]|uniref:Uncharacterized protein n=1 Tax=Collybia nuda TaxID=64659 RepID=A0A9P5XWN1_9AGAR|nr:hypothetical protein BDZ94DRAFT_286191 [Collybia nuda]
MTSLVQSTPVKAAPTTSQSFKSTMPNDTEPTLTTTSSSKTPIKLPTTSSSSGTKPTSHSTTSFSSRLETSTSVSNRPPTSPKPQVASPIAPPKTTTSVSFEGSPSLRSTRTSTITDHPESTFSKVVAVTLTNNGTVALSTPAMVTVFSTSTLPDGDFVTFTHVVANPTGFDGGNQAFKTTG